MTEREAFEAAARLRWERQVEYEPRHDTYYDEEIDAAAWGWQAAAARYAGVEAALRLVLPLAKGYAAEHAVGSNQQYVEEAAAALAALDGAK